MGVFQWVLSAQTFAGFLIAIGLWIVGKIIDRILDAALGKKLIQPFLQRLKFRAQSFLTRIDPIDASFYLSYSPRDEYTAIEIKEKLKDVLDEVRESSGERLDTAKIKWNGVDGETSVKHIGSSYEYQVDIHLVTEKDDEIEDPGIAQESRIVKNIEFNIGFKFSFPELESELPNLGIFASRLKSSLENELFGIPSQGKIILHPIESELSVDEWINEKGFEISLLLADGDEEGADKTEVEFFPDHVELHPPYYEVDSEVMEYVRLLVRNYYFRKRSASNLLKLKDIRGK
ncbi:hypothetical protein [Halosimplex sp. J119]